MEGGNRLFIHWSLVGPVRQLNQLQHVDMNGTLDFFRAHESILTGEYSIGISKPDTSRLIENPEQLPATPIPAAHRKAPSPPTDVPPPPPHTPLVQGELRLPRQIICHSQNVQRLMERRRISWGVQYELARGVLAERWTWENITDRVLDRLQGPNAVAAPKVRSVMTEAIGEGDTGYRVDFGTTTRELWLVLQPNVETCEGSTKPQLTALPGLNMTESRRRFLRASHEVWV